MKYQRFLVSLLAMFFILQSCDEIDTPYLKETNEIIAKRTILLEEFTGHQCPNCPGGAVAVKDIVTAYGERVVVVAIHTNYNGRTSASFPTEYRTSTGNELDAKFKMEESGLPKGMVNRIGFETAAHKITSDELAGKVAEVLQEEPVVDISIGRSYIPDERKVNIDVNVSILEQMQRKIMLSVYITEDSLVSAQKNSNAAIGITPVIEDYVHRHVLRAAVNGTWGDILCQGNLIPPGAGYTRAYQYTLAEGWKENDCSVVAFVYDGVTYEVLQAAEIKIK